MGRSPECALERDKLSAMEKPSARAAPDTVDAQRKRVAENCPLVETSNVWLLKMVWPPAEPSPAEAASRMQFRASALDLLTYHNKDVCATR